MKDEDGWHGLARSSSSCGYRRFGVSSHFVGAHWLEHGKNMDLGILLYLACKVIVFLESFVRSSLRLLCHIVHVTTRLSPGPGWVVLQYCLQEYDKLSLLYCDAYYVIVRQFRFFSDDGHHRLTSTHHSDWGPSFTRSRSL